MTVFHDVWMLCATGTVVLATAVWNRIGCLALTLGFSVTTAWTMQSGRSLDASWMCPKDLMPQNGEPPGHMSQVGQVGRARKAGRLGRPDFLVVLFVSLVVALFVVPFVLPASRVLGAQASRPSAKPVRIAFVFSDGNISGTMKAYRALLGERPDFRSTLTLRFLTESIFDDVKPAELTDVDVLVLVLDVMNQQMLDRYNTTHRIDLVASVRAHGRVIAVGEGLLPKETDTNQGAVWDDRARALWGHSGFANQVGLLKFALTQAGVTGLIVPEALPSLDFGYIYNVDVVGEGLVARRRGMATLIDHMVPPFKKGGLYPQLAELAETISDFEKNEGKNPELAKAYLEKVREQVVGLGIAKDLSLDLAGPGSLQEDAIHQIENHLLELKGQSIPYGLHAFGRTPEKPLRESTIDAIVGADRSLLPDKAKVLAEEIEDRIVVSGPRELDNLLHAMRGGFVPAGSGGEPIRNPDSYPTGKNFYGIDPDKVPKPASWELGVKLAEQMLADHLTKHGKYPEKVSFVIWGDETMRHEGVLESQVFYLLGTRPIWDARGKVIDVEVIPSARLGRPRVDIVIASAAEGMFHNVTLLMDQAVQKVKAIDEAENVVRRHYLQTKSLLMAKGYSEQDADRRAGVRIFDEPPGIFNLNTSTIVAASGTWDSDKGFADDYIRKLGHGYGNGFWGEPMADVFRLALSGTEKVVHSSSTMLYGALDNDDMFMYMGGLAAAIRNIDGKSPEMIVTNTRDPGHPEMTSMDKVIGMKDFFERNSPYAYQDMAGRMVETVRKGYWDADAATKTKLLAEYVDSVNEHGASGAEFTSGNPRLSKDVLEQGKAAGIPVPALEGFQRAMEDAIGATVSNAASATENFVRRNEAAPLAAPQSSPVAQDLSSASRESSSPIPSRSPVAQDLSALQKPLKGYLMEEKDRSRSSSAMPVPLDFPPWVTAGLTLPVLVYLLVWRRRHRRR